MSPRRPPRPASHRYAGLGMRRIWVGSLGLIAIQLLFDAGQTAQNWDRYHDPAPAIAAWALLVVSAVSVITVTATLGEHLPTWMFWLYAVALALVIALDLRAAWSFDDAGMGLSVGVSAAISLIIAAAVRPGREIVVVAGALTAEAAIGIALHGSMAPPMLHNAVFTLCQMLLPSLVAVILIDRFRDLVRREIDQTLSQSAITAPRLTVGIEASEQLARLDLAAESLLGAVADGRIPLPLTPDVAKRAGGLATDLRLHLLESRSRTWLNLAIEESVLLRSDVVVEDRDSVAGLLNTRQRGALLSALWLLHEEQGERPHSAQDRILVGLDRPVQSTESEALAAIHLRVTVPGASRMSIDPGVWERFAQVGRYWESASGDQLLVDIRCLVPSPKRTGGA